MKNLKFIMMLAAGLGLASCSSSHGPKANLQTEMDTLSYMIGVNNNTGLMEYVQSRLGVDSAYIADFKKGVVQGAKITDEKQKAYMAGMQIGLQVGGDMIDNIQNQVLRGDSVNTLSKNDFIAGFISYLFGETDVTTEEASEYLHEFTENKKLRENEIKYAEWKKQNEDFIAENKTKDGIQVTESGLQYRIIKKGTGEIPTSTSSVDVNYKGTLIDGTEFDSSYKRNKPSTFKVKSVIKGWAEALQMMPVGSKWELYIPNDLAYGAKQSGKVKPFSALIFEVELVKINPEKEKKAKKVEKTEEKKEEKKD